MAANVNVSVRRASLVLASALLCASAAHAVNGPGSLFVSGATHTPTHWNIQKGVATTAEIRGVTTAEAGSPLPATITVIVKSSVNGNTNLVATRIGSTSNYTFTYTPAANACNTTVVAYISNGRNADNDLLDDGQQNNSQNSACGFRFVNAAGEPIDCGAVAVEPSTWGSVKKFFE